MNTYTADPSTAGAAAGSREWAFGALATPGQRERYEQLSQLDLRRRPGCEPALQSLVTGAWTSATQHHLGWCESCCAAAVALGPSVAAASSPRRRRAVWLAIAAGVVILVPLAGSRLIDDPLSSSDARGGVARAVKAPIKPVARSKGASATSTAGGAVVGAAAGGKAVGVRTSATGSKSAAGTKGAAGVKGSTGGAGKAGAAGKNGKAVLPITT